MEPQIAWSPIKPTNLQVGGDLGPSGKIVKVFLRSCYKARKYQRPGREVEEEEYAGRSKKIG